MVKNFRTLNLAINQYKEIKSLKLKGEVRSQVERAALSVCLNLSEGNAKLQTKERRRFFNISYASQKEVQTLLELENINHLIKNADILGACLYRLQQHVR